MYNENKISEHTVKKFELIAHYVETWAHTLLNTKDCKELVFIDCMCNSGIYEDDGGNRVEGTPIRVAQVIADAMTKYSDKKAVLYFNDSDAEKIAELERHLPAATDNFRIETSIGDGNDLLKKLKPALLKKDGVHYLLFYDPYTASINWEVLAPYFFGWGEFILNHMLSDSVRALKQAKRPEVKHKYEQTYLTPFESLMNSVGDRKEYEQRLVHIIENLCQKLSKKYYVVTIPFFIKTNALIYDLVFFTKHIKGFKKFKTAAWKTFGGKSSNQNTHGAEIQQTLFPTTPEDKQCYTVSDIADYIVDNFKERKTVSFAEIWNFVDEHPIFPTEGYKNEIKDKLTLTGRCKVGRSTIDFA